jgi:hypothetical protein
MALSVLVTQLCQGVEGFLATTLPIITPSFHGLLKELLAREGRYSRMVSR